MAMFTGRIVQSRSLRLFFLGMATLAAALGFPVKVDPPPKRRTPVEVVRDEDDLAGVPSDSVR
jgi:hypothetical protein